MNFERPAISDLLTQYAEDASFLWELRRRAVREPHYSLSDIVKLDGRIDSHVEGLSLSAQEAWPLLEESLETGEAGELFSATSLALVLAKPSCWETVFKAALEHPEHRAGLVSALGWAPAERSRASLSEMLSSKESSLRAAALRAQALKREHPGPSLESAIRSEDAALAVSGCRAAGELGRTELLAALQSRLDSKDDDVRQWALWSGALLGGQWAKSALAAAARAPEALDERIFSTAIRVMDAEGRKKLFGSLSQDKSQGRAACMLAAASGDFAFVPWLLEAMHNPPLARIAGHAFSMVTGVDIAYEDLHAPEPDETIDAGPNDDPEDENVELDPDENLPWPNPALLSQWWEKKRPHFPPGQRYLLGQPIAREWLQKVLREGKQPARLAAAEELKLLESQKPLFECRARGADQLRALG